MPLAIPPRNVILPPLETLLIAAAGGIAFAKLGIPAGLVSGSVLAVAIAALAGRQMRVPTMVQRVCFSWARSSRRRRSRASRRGRSALRSWLSPPSP